MSIPKGHLAARDRRGAVAAAIDDLHARPMATTAHPHAAGAIDPDGRAGSAASRALRAGLNHVAAEAEAARLRLYRDFLAATVTGVAPVLLDLCRAGGLDLDGLAWGMAPGDAWPTWFCGTRPRLAHYWTKGRAGWHLALGGKTAISEERRRFTDSALSLRTWDDPEGPFAIRAVEGCVDVGVGLGRAVVRTRGSRCKIALAASLPECVCIALPGRDVAAAVSHPLLEGRGYVVTDVLRGRGTLLRLGFEAPPVPWKVPWGR